MTTPRKLTIAAVVLLVGGVMVALVVRRPSRGLVLTLETNRQGHVTVSALVSNASPVALGVTIALETDPAAFVEPLGLTHTFFLLEPSTAHVVPLPRTRPCRLTADGCRFYSDTRLDRLRGFLVHHLRLRNHTATLDIP